MTSAMPVQPQIQLIDKLNAIPQSLGVDEDLKDLLKTIQIQLCMKQSELSLMTMKKLIIIH